MLWEIINFDTRTVKNLNNKSQIIKKNKQKPIEPIFIVAKFIS